MGLVKMAHEISGYWEDLNGEHPYARATLYIYCDKCGSFSIRTRINYRKTSLIIFTVILLAFGILATLHLKGGIFWLCFCLVVCILAFRYLWGGADYVCRKCGTVPTTRFNTLGYQSDISILDVPDRLVQKRYHGYWAEDYDVYEALMSPPGLLPEGESVALKLHNDLEGIKTHMLPYILGIPLLIIMALIYPIFIIVALVWTGVISKLLAALFPMFPRNNG